MAGATMESTVAWLVDCGIPARLAINKEMATENKMIETTVNDIISGFSNPLPTVVAVPLPAIIAPRNTMIPNKPGIKLFRITFAPYAAEKAGAVPLPPMVIARNMAMIKGISRWLNKGETIIALFIKLSFYYAINQSDCFIVGIK